jgi:hypothetical protein
VRPAPAVSGLPSPLATVGVELLAMCGFLPVDPIVSLPGQASPLAWSPAPELLAVPAVMLLDALHNRWPDTAQDAAGGYRLHPVPLLDLKVRCAMVVTCHVVIDLVKARFCARLYRQARWPPPWDVAPGSAPRRPLRHSRAR